VPKTRLTPALAISLSVRGGVIALASFSSTFDPH
jgi:hypothetical protein